MVIRSADVERLSEFMRSCQAEDPPRTVPFLLGDLCGTRAGVPTATEMGRAAMRSLFEHTPEYAARVLPAGPDASNEEVRAAFLAWLGGMTHAQRYRVLAPFYRRVPVPVFYQDLAELMLAGYVTHVLTTSVDSLLEQALDALGLAAGRDYGIVVLGLPDPPEPTTGHAPPATIVKLHGDLGSSQLPMTPDEIEGVLRENRTMLRGELANDLVVVGHEVEDAAGDSSAIDHWLARGRGEVWWVHPEQPPYAAMGPMLADRPVTYLTGPDQGEPEAFFGQLTTYLLRLPAAQVLAPLSAIPRNDDEFTEAYLQSRIDKAQVTKYDFVQQTSPGDDNIGLSNQIGYQADKVAAWGEQLRELQPVDVPQLLDRLVVEVEAAGIDRSTVGYLQEQARTVALELSTEQPNELLVAGAVTAASSVCQRLGSVVSTGLARDLRSAAATYRSQA